MDGGQPFPATPGHWTWDELGRLLRALGFSGELFAAQVQSTHGPGLSQNEVLEIIDSHKLDKYMDKTANWHSGIYNARALRTALQLLEKRLLSFDQVHMARVAFNLYENEEDHEGLVVQDTQTILRALKMTGKAIAIVNLETEIRRAAGTTKIPVRLQLDEFFKLLGSCTDILSVQLETSQVDDERLDRKLSGKKTTSNSNRAINTTARPQTSSGPSRPSTVATSSRINIQRRKTMSETSSSLIRSDMSLRDVIRESNQSLHKARFSSGNIQGLQNARVKSAPCSQRSRSRMESKDNLEDTEWCETFDLSSMSLSSSSPQPFSVDNYTSKSVELTKPPVVKKEDILEHQSLMEDLKWDIHTANDDNLRKYSKRFSFSSSGFTSSRPQTVGSEPKTELPRNEQVGSERVFKSVFERVAERQPTQEKLPNRRLSSGRIRYNFDKGDDHWSKLSKEKRQSDTDVSEGFNSDQGKEPEVIKQNDENTSDRNLRLQRRRRSTLQEDLGKSSNQPLPVRDWSKPGKWAYK